MTPFEQANASFIEAKKNQVADPENFYFCVSMAICQIELLKAQLLEEGYKFHVDVPSCRWAIEKKIIHRKEGETMMGAAHQYVESVENKVLSSNGLL